MKIDYEMLEDEYGTLPKKGKVAESTKPIGSLTDNLRHWKPRRDGSHKRITDTREWDNA